MCFPCVPDTEQHKLPGLQREEPEQEFPEEAVRDNSTAPFKVEAFRPQDNLQPMGTPVGPNRFEPIADADSDADSEDDMEMDAVDGARLLSLLSSSCSAGVQRPRTDSLALAHRAVDAERAP